MSSRLSFEYDGISVERFPLTNQAIMGALEEGVAPGFVAGLWLRDRPGRAWVGAWGSIEKSGAAGVPRPMESRTVFDLASVSKVMGATALAGVLVDRGWIRWADPLKSFFPDYPSEAIEIRHLLSHTAGLPAWAPLWQSMKERAERTVPEWIAAEGVALERVAVSQRQAWMCELLLAIPPEAPPGVRAVYSDICFLLLGFVLEKVTGFELDHAVRKFVWEPMGIETAFYHRIPSALPLDPSRIAPTEVCSWRMRTLRGEVHDDNCWSMGGYGGHAGAFGDVDAVLRFTRALHSRFLSFGTLQAMWTRVPAPPGCGRTLGWDTPSGADSSASELFADSSVGHLGFTGTSLWIDREAGLAVTLLSNRVHPTRENALIKAFRPVFHRSLRRDLAQGALR